VRTIEDAQFLNHPESFFRHLLNVTP